MNKEVFGIKNIVHADQSTVMCGAQLPAWRSCHKSLQLRPYSIMRYAPKVRKLNCHYDALLMHDLDASQCQNLLTANRWTLSKRIIGIHLL